MKVLLDENFPLGLLRRLHADGFAAEHIITLGWRGASDTRIREHLQDEQLLFLTQDDDFLFGPALSAIIVVSRVKQSRQGANRALALRPPPRPPASVDQEERNGFDRNPFRGIYDDDLRMRATKPRTLTSAISTSVSGRSSSTASCAKGSFQCGGMAARSSGHDRLRKTSSHAARRAT